MKKILIVMASAVMMFSLTGCSLSAFEKLKEISYGVDEDMKDGNLDDISFLDDLVNLGQEEGFTESDFEDFMDYSDGSFDIPSGWEVSSRNSTADKVFFIQKGDEDTEIPDNISVNFGTNSYSASEHVQFREAILSQLAAQVPENTNIHGEGTTSANGLTVYAFTMTNDDDDTVSQQIYIVGDYEYCLVYLTCFDNHQSCKDAAKAIVDSFEWK